MTGDDTFKARREIQNKRRRELYAERKKLQCTSTFRQTRPEFFDEAGVTLDDSSSSSE